jgi:DNA polymerase-3 subunit epsilon
MKVLGLDFEITGLSPENDRITEVGAVLWDWNLSAPVCLLSSFVDPQRAIPAEITALTGITDQLIEDYARTEEDVFADLDYLISRADCVMAHNGTTFDKPFCVAAYSRVGRVIPNKPWLDTRTDIKYPEHITTRNLRHLASEHSFLNPFAHRAVFDVLTMLKVATTTYRRSCLALRSRPSTFRRL